MSATEPDILDDAGVRAMLSVSERTLRRILANDGLPHTFITPGKRRYVRDDVIGWMRARAVTSTVEARASKRRVELVRRSAAGLRIAGSPP